MTRKMYSGYSVEELLENKEFVSLVKSIQSEDQWNLLLEENHDSRNELMNAKRVIDLFIEKSKVLDSETKEDLWQSIKLHEREISSRPKFYQLNRYLKVAASILLVASIGGLAYLYFHTKDQNFQFSDAPNQKTVNPLLILANGKQVDIQKTDPNIKVLKGQNAIQVDNDSILTNQPLVDNTTNAVRYNEMIVPFGKRTTLLLSDGTKVWLNAGSRMAFPQNFEKGKREVFLEGEAIFEVAKKMGEPFLVNTKYLNIHVTGTVFNVTAYADDAACSAVLAEGKIELTSKGGLFSKKTIHMLPGTKVTYDPEDKSLTSEQVEPYEYLSWRDGFMVIHGEKLNEILKKLSRYYNVQINLEDPATAAESFSGRLDLKDSPREVLTVISNMVPLNISEQNNIINIKPKHMSE